MNKEVSDRIFLSITRTGLNRLVAKSSKIRAKRRRFKNTKDPFGEILIYLTNYTLKIKLDKGMTTTFAKEWSDVISFWTPEKIDLFIQESSQFYHYRRFTYADREEVPAILPFSQSVAQILLWFEEVKKH